MSSGANGLSLAQSLEILRARLAEIEQNGSAPQEPSSSRAATQRAQETYGSSSLSSRASLSSRTSIDLSFQDPRAASSSSASVSQAFSRLSLDTPTHLRLESEPSSDPSRRPFSSHQSRAYHPSSLPQPTSYSSSSRLRLESNAPKATPAPAPSSLVPQRVSTENVPLPPRTIDFFGQLPEALSVFCLTYLTTYELVTFGQACSEYHRLHRSPVLWKLKGNRLGYDYDFSPLRPLSKQDVVLHCHKVGITLKHCVNPEFIKLCNETFQKDLSSIRSMQSSFDQRILFDQFLANHSNAINNMQQSTGIWFFKDNLMFAQDIDHLLSKGIKLNPNLLHNNIRQGRAPGVLKNILRSQLPRDARLITLAIQHNNKDPTSLHAARDEVVAPHAILTMLLQANLNPTEAEVNTFFVEAVKQANGPALLRILFEAGLRPDVPTARRLSEEHAYVTPLLDEFLFRVDGGAAQ